MFAELATPEDTARGWLDLSTYGSETETLSSETKMERALGAAQQIADQRRRGDFYRELTDKLADVQTIRWFLPIARNANRQPDHWRLWGLLAGKLAELDEPQEPGQLISEIPDAAEQRAAHENMAAVLAITGKPQATLPETSAEQLALAFARARKIEEALAAVARITDEKQWFGVVENIVRRLAESGAGQDVDDGFQVITSHLNARLSPEWSAVAHAALGAVLSDVSELDQLDIGQGGASVPGIRYLRAALYLAKGDSESPSFRENNARVLAAFALKDETGDPEKAAYALYDRLELAKDQAQAYLGLATKCLKHDASVFADDALRWLLAQANTAYIVGWLTQRSVGIDDPTDFVIVKAELDNAIYPGLGKVVSDLVRKGDATGASNLAECILDPDGWAYLQAQLAAEQRQAGHMEQAATAINEAQAELAPRSSPVWPDGRAAVAAELAAQGRIPDGLALLSGLDTPEERNYLRDSMSCALVRLGRLEEGLGIVKEMEKQDSMDGMRSRVILHEATALAAAALAQRGDWEKASALLLDLTDPFACVPGYLASDELARAIAKNVRAQPERAAQIVFRTLQKASTNGQQDVLAALYSLAPVLQACGDAVPLETWRRLVETQQWLHRKEDEDCAGNEIDRT